MLFPLLEFGSVLFCVLFAIFCGVEIAFFRHRNESSAIFAMFIFGALSAVFVSSWPKITWSVFGGYVIGALLWIPIYWYLTLLRNRRSLTLCVDQYERNRFGVLKDNLWLPNHPQIDDLIANGILWPIAAPLYMADQWITAVIDFMRVLMDRIQTSMAVKAVEDERRK